MEYPFLGRNYVKGKAYVVMFTEPDYGVVLMDETDADDIKFGQIGAFDEGMFELLPPDECIRINN